MSKIKFIEFSGNEHSVEGIIGESLMEIALSNDVPGIEADCGGSCACGTCHVYIENDWFDKLEEKTDMENSMLEFTDNVNENSRLSCQIEFKDELDGLEVRLPESQY
ncbi:MAG: 2Fe-2S iron-sulfur cluster-binding protein [SAR86 cluster bacterium]|nr:2Fe-2S iron-sulfur cluster-binding protein [SAR86 cluster bacterium]|tara:strand:+ start:2066 stop:2386 length:321 start_codon:yes stop_codon:yes gene_type:complete